MDDYTLIRDAIVFIADHVDEQPDLTSVAAHVGVSPTRLQRTFAEWAGISPKRFLQHLTASRAREHLARSSSVLEAAYAVGLSGSGRLHDLMLVAEAMTPGQVASGGSGVRVRHGLAPTPFGPARAAITDKGVCALHFADALSEQEFLDGLARRWPSSCMERDDASVAQLLEPAFAGSRAPLHVRGTNFQLRVWEALLAVPEGCLISYGDLAARAGMPDATRAVATAVGSNEIGYLIPCHRVLRASGALGGYRWGTDRKLVMLERELR